MTFDEWTPRYRRLVKAFSKTENGEQCAAYFEALAKFPESAVEHALAKVIADERYWPSASVIREHAQNVLAGSVYTPSTCQKCHGDTWVDAPDQEHFRRAYTNFVNRCPICSSALQAPA